MSKIFSFFRPEPPRPAPAPTPPPEPAPVKKQEKKSSKRAQLIALKATGAAGLTGEANVGRRKILV